MSDIDLTEAYDAAAEVVRRNARVRPSETVIDAAVVPNILGAYHSHLVVAIREQIAREIEARADLYEYEPDVYQSGVGQGLLDAAGIARGES